MSEDGDAVPPARQCTMPDCPAEAVDPSGKGGLCPAHAPDVDTAGSSNQQNTPETGGVLVNDTDAPEDAGEEGGSPDERRENGFRHRRGGRIRQYRLFGDGVGFLSGDAVRPMGRRGKLPFAPWGDKNPDDAAPDDSPRWEWGRTENHVDGDTVAMAEDDPRLDGRVFIQRDSDPFVFVDGDDVRDPDTGTVHPEFIALLGRLGFTYADVSTSGAGVHAYYTGDLPGEQGEAVFEIDTEPWGSNDDPPTVEIYANKHVCVATGDHAAGTPDDVAEWDAAEVGAILDEYDARKETPEDVGHDTDRDRADLDDHTPTATTAGETTDDVRDVLKAVDALRPSDLRLRTSAVGTDATGWEQWDPSTYRTSSGGDSLHRPAGEPVFHDHKHGESFGVLSLLAAEEGIITHPWDRLRGEEWWDAVDAAREQGAPIPEYDGPTAEDTEQVAVLPPGVRDLSTATSGWDWRHAAGEDQRSLSIDDARERTVAAISDAYERDDQVLVEALPTMGKSYGAIKAAADTGEQVTVLTGRGQKEQYAQFKEWAAEFGLSYYQLPSFTHDCPTAGGDHGEEWAEKVRGWYRRGATPQVIHAYAEDLLGRPLPCQCDDDGGHVDCPYASKWRFDPDEYDVLIGHYTHAYKPKVTTGRVAVLDEFPEDAYETTLSGTGLQGAVSYWLSTADAVPFDSYTDLIENRDDDARRADALAYLLDGGLEPDEKHVLDDHAARADAPLAVATLLAGEDLGNGFEKAALDDVGTGVFNRSTGAVSVLQPPALDYASGVVALDGTPTKRMWELSLGERLNRRQVLQDGERGEYIRDALNLNLVRTTEYVKPYNSADHVYTEEDAALLERVGEEHGERPGVITTSTAEAEYDAAGVLDAVDSTRHYGNVLGSNEYKHKRVGAVIGSNHYGDEYIKKWGAYAGRDVGRDGGKGRDLSYGPFGDDVLTHMREHDTLQAAMRFGRDGNGAVVYVHTDTLPDWVPLAGEGRVVSTWGDGMRQVVRAVEDLGTAPTAEIADHPAVDVGRRQVFDHLETLRRRGVLDREQDGEDGRRVRWVDDGIHRLNDHGEVTLDAVDLDDLGGCEVQELARSSSYTWEFLNRGGGSATEDGDAVDVGPRTSDHPASRGDSPPDPAD